MLSQEERELYSRHLLLNEVGESGQLKLKNSSVLVIGAGGLGCPVLQYLNAAGVGTIGIVDFDVVDKSNLQRQVLFDLNSIDKNKASEAKAKLEQSNAINTIIAYQDRITTENASELVGQYDVIVDCTDNYETRYLVNDACVLNNKPLVYAAIFKYEGQVSVFNYNNGPTYRCVYPTPPKSASITNCSESGVIGVLAGIIGTMQANEVIKIILGIGTPLSGVLSIYSSLTGQMNNFKVSRKENKIYTELLATGKINTAVYSFQNCVSEQSELNEINLDNFLEEIKKGVILIDVREADEEPLLHELGAIKLPLSQIENTSVQLEDKRTIVFCKSGVRSKKAIELLQKKYNLQKLINLKNGIQSYSTIEQS